MTDITPDVWDKVVKNSPYVHLYYEEYGDEQELELFDSEGYFVGNVKQPALYTSTLSNEADDDPRASHNAFSPLKADENYIGVFTYQVLDLDNDYYDLITYEKIVDDMEALVSFLTNYIPQNMLDEHNIKLVKKER